MRKNRGILGFTLPEVIVSVAVFSLLAFGVYGSLHMTTKVAYESKVNTVVTQLLNEQLEAVRNMSYSDIGIVGGNPNGLIPSSSTTVRSGITFTVTSTVKLLGTPPSDYKFVEFTAWCDACAQKGRSTMNTNIGGADNGGAAFVPVSSITINPTTANVQVNGIQNFTATVNPADATNQNLDWKIDEGVSYGTVNGSGTYVAPGTVPAGQATVRVTAKDGSGVSAVAKVTVLPANVLVNGITISPDPGTTNTGGTISFVPTVTPSNATDKTVDWTVISGGGTIASDGTYIAPATPGTATVQATAKDGSGVSDTVNVTINPTLVTSVAVNDTSVAAGGTVTVTANVLPANANNKTVTWSMVSGGGTINASTGVYLAPATPGTAVVKATATDGSGVSGTGTVTITAVPVTSVTVNDTSVAAGGTVTVTANVLPSNASNKSLTWSVVSGGGSINASTGLYTAPATPGTATVRATANDGSGATDTGTVTINAVSVTSVTVNNTSVAAGGTVTVTATVLPSNASNKTVTWSVVSGGGSINASTGLYTAPATPGTATVRATANDGSGATDTGTVTITAIPVTSVTVNNTSVAAGGTVTVTANVLPSNASDKTVTWSVVSGGGTINASTGLFTAPTTPGTTTVRATANDGSGKSGTGTVTINPVLVTLVTVNNTSVAAGGTVTVTANVLPANASNKTVTWSVVSGGGSINASTGLFTAPATPGTTTVKATAADGSGKSGTGTVTINSILVTSISVTPNPASVNVNNTVTLTANVLPANASNKTVTWSVVSGGGSVNSSGVYTAPASAGSATVRATATDGSGKYGQTTVTINQPTVLVTNITFSPTAVQVVTRQNYDFVISITPSGATNKTVTWSVTEGSDYGTVTPIDATHARYTAPIFPPLNGYAHVRATATDGSGVYGEATVEILPGTLVVKSDVTNDLIHWAYFVTGDRSRAFVGSYQYGESLTTWTVNSSNGSATYNSAYVVNPDVYFAGKALVIHDTTLYAANYYGSLDIFNITNTTPTLISSNWYQDVMWGSHAMEYYETGGKKYVFVTNHWNQSFLTWDVTDPNNPVLKKNATYNAIGAAGRDMHIRGNYIYVSLMPDESANPQKTGLMIVNVADPLNPQFVKYYLNDATIGNPEYFDIQGDYLYMVNRSANKLEILNIASNPTSPTIVATLTDSTYLKNVFAIKAYGNYAYASTYDNDGMTVISIKNPSSPSILTSSSITSNSSLEGFNHMFISGQYIYAVTDGGAPRVTSGVSCHRTAPSPCNTDGSTAGHLLILGF